jgi:hypothetical protein
MKPGPVTSVGPPPHSESHINKYMNIFDKYFKESVFPSSEQCKRISMKGQE